MNARVFMVLVFSSVFMGIWNSDQKAMHSAIARNKRLSKPVATFPIPPVETVRSENLLPVEFAVPEPRPVRVAMRASDSVGQSEPVIERHEEQSEHQADAEMPIVTLTPVSEDVPAPQKNEIEVESIPVEVTVEAVVTEQAPAEPVIPELVMSESESVAEAEEASSTETSVEEVQPKTIVATEASASLEPADAEPVMTQTEEPAHSHTETTESRSEEVPAVMSEIDAPASEVPASEVPASETPVAETIAEIEQDAVPAPEDFSVEVKADAHVTEVAKEVAKTEVPVTTEAPVMIAENSTEETAAAHYDEVPAQSEQPVTESAAAELAEPSEPITEEPAVNSDTVAMNEAESKTADSNAGESGEDEESLEEKLLTSGEYDMLDVHSEDVSPGSVEPAIDGGATCIPLPRNLASGTWQVIHSSGEFFKITIDRGRNTGVSGRENGEELLETSFCITTTPDGVRWCFIRSFIDSPAPVRRVTTEFFSPGQQ